MVGDQALAALLIGWSDRESHPATVAGYESYLRRLLVDASTDS